MLKKTRTEERKDWIKPMGNKDYLKKRRKMRERKRNDSKGKLYVKEIKKKDEQKKKDERGRILKQTRKQKRKD